MSVREGRLAACLCCESKPGAAGLRGSLGPPLSRQISPCCSARRRSSWQLKSYPSWEGRRGWRQRAGTTQKSTLLSPRWQDIYSQFLAQTPRILSPSPCVSQEIFARPGFGHCGHCCRFQFLLCTVWSIVAKVMSDKDGTGDANAPSCRGKSAGEFWWKHGHREVKLIRALAVRSRKLAQKALVNPQQQVSRAVRVPIWKVSCKINRKYSGQVDSSRLQPLFFCLSSSIISKEWDSGVLNPFTPMD